MGVSPQEAIGKRYTHDFGIENPEYFDIIGVVKDFNFDSLKEDINALSLHLGDEAYAMAIKIEAGDFTKNIARIEAIWNTIAPGQPFDYYFMEDSFNDTYQSERRLGNIFIIFTILSLLIACLGLFGLAAFNAEKRVKEIGVRKVLDFPTYRLVRYEQMVGRFFVSYCYSLVGICASRFFSNSNFNTDRKLSKY